MDIVLLLDRLGVDVLTIRGEDHRLDTPGDVEVLVLIKVAEVSRPEPAVGSEERRGGLRILVVPLADILPTDLDLAHLVSLSVLHDVIRLGDASLLDHRHDLADTAMTVALRLLIADERGALGHAVADGEGKAGLHQEVGDLVIECGTADDEEL